MLDITVCQLTKRLVLALAELVRIVVRVVGLRSKVRGQLVDGDGHLSRLEMQQTGLVGDAAEIVRQERRQTGESELGAPDIGRYLDETGNLGTRIQ